MIAFNTAFRVHLRVDDHYRPRPVPILGLREGFEGEPLTIALVPDIGDSNRVIEVASDSLALCFDACRICSNATRDDNRRPQNRRTA